MSQNTAFDAPTKLWAHPNPSGTQLHTFKEQVAQKYKLSLPTYHDLWQWSVDHAALFWEEIWCRTGIVAAKPYNTVRLSHPSPSVETNDALQGPG